MKPIEIGSLYIGAEMNENVETGHCPVSAKIILPVIYFFFLFCSSAEIDSRMDVSAMMFLYFM
jgi:hypothetical protein